MKTMTIEEVQSNLSAVLDDLDSGQVVRLLRDGKATDLTAKPVFKVTNEAPPGYVPPDYAGRLKAIYGDRILPGNAVLDERASYDA